MENVPETNASRLDVDVDMSVFMQGRRTKKPSGEGLVSLRVVLRGAGVHTIAMWDKCEKSKCVRTRETSRCNDVHTER